MNQEWSDTFEKNGFKLISWGEVGQYRYFSEDPAEEAERHQEARARGCGPRATS